MPFLSEWRNTSSRASGDSLLAPPSRSSYLSCRLQKRRQAPDFPNVAPHHPDQWLVRSLDRRKKHAMIRPEENWAARMGG
jgi:hypothetical protein